MDIPKITSERIDDLPLLLAVLQRMRVAAIIDAVLPPPHKNRRGLTYGELAMLFIAYMLMRCTHFLSPMQAWAQEHTASLTHALGKPVRPEDCSDERLAIVLEHVGNGDTRPFEQIEQQLGQHIIEAYALPTDIARIDATSVSVYHEPDSDDGLMRFGHSKDHRPDLRQFKLVLSTIDPGGLPLASETIAGNESDDRQYIQAWERLASTLKRTDFLCVGDCKLASLENRAHIRTRKGFYLAPLPMTGDVPDELRAWVNAPPGPMTEILLPDAENVEHVVGRGFEVTVKNTRIDPKTKKTTTWNERRLVIQSDAHAEAQRLGLHKRLARVERGIAALNKRPGDDRSVLEARAQALVKSADATDYVRVSVEERTTHHTRVIGPGRPGPRRPTHTVEMRKLVVEFERDSEAIAAFECLAGFRQYATNASKTRLGLSQAVACYRQQWQPERGFSRLKGGLVSIMPLYLQSDDRIRGLITLMVIALRALVLIEFVVRRALAKTKDSLPGLYAGNPGRTTDQPTTERMLRAFEYISLYCYETVQGVGFQVGELSPLQKRILELLDIPLSTYAPPLQLRIQSG
jgi:transposase